MSNQQSLYLRGYRLITAEIIYHLPDHPYLLQSFIWQEMDLKPKFPVLKSFLDFWSKNLDGKLHSVKFAQETDRHPDFFFADIEIRSAAQ